MEQTETQKGITEEATSPDIPAGETKVSETEQVFNRRVQSEVDKRLNTIYQERDSHKQRADALERSYQDLQKQNEKLDADISQMQDEAYRDDPEALKSARTKRQLLKDKQAVEQQRQENERIQVALGMQVKLLDVAEISAKYGINPIVLEKADVQNREELEDFARKITGERKPGGKSPNTPVYDRGISDASSGKHFTAASIASFFIFFISSISS